MTILLVGCGYWGQNWAKTLYRLGALQGICEPNLETQLALKEKYPDVPLYNSLEEALSQSPAKGVVIATPVPTHLAMARQCLLAEKAVLVEKPMTLVPEESQELVDLAAEKNLILAVGHILMYHPALLKLQQLVREGVLGDVLSVQCTRVNLGKIRNEENCWWSLAPHDISILSMLLEEPFEPVSASKMNLLGRPGIEDTVYVTFETPSGRYGTIHNSWLSPVKKHETVVMGSRKIAIFEDTQPVEKKLMLMDYDLQRTDDQVESIQKGDVTYVSYETPDELLALEAKGFIQAIEQGTPLQNNGENALQVVQILDKVQHMFEQQQSLCAV